MAIELPGEVVSFLQLIGVNWPDIDEDKVREFASHVREFADNLQETKQAVADTLEQLGEHYQGASYDALIARWNQLSGSHMHEVAQGCHVVATALDVAADVIVAMKLETIAELVVMAATFVADQAAAVATFGLAEAAVVLIEEAAKKLVDYLEQQLEQYIIGMVIEAAIDPLVELVAGAAEKLAVNAVESALSSAVGGSSSGFYIDPEGLAQFAELMHRHAETVAGHTEAFTGKLAGVDFE